jgi:putative transposase
LVDGLGLLIASRVGPANLHDQHGARLLLGGLRPLQPRLVVVYADGAYAGEALADWCRGSAGVELRVVRRLRIPRFEVLPRRWIVERTLAWLGRNRRLAKDYEGRVQTTELLMEVAMIALMLRRLAPA